MQHGIAANGPGHRHVFRGAPRDPAPQRGADQAGGEIKQQQQPRFVHRKAACRFEEEHQQRAAKAGRQAGEQIDQHQPAQIGLFQRLPDIAPAVRMLAGGTGGLAVGHAQRHREQGGRKHQRQHQPHGMDAERRRGGKAQLRPQPVGQRRHRQQGEQGDHVGGLPPAKDATAFVIICGQRLAPAGVGDLCHRKADVDHQQAQKGAQRRQAGLGKKAEIQTKQHDQAARHHPRTKPAKARARAVDAVPEGDIQRQIDPTHGREQNAGDGQIKTQRAGIVRRQIDHHRQADAGKRQARRGKGGERPAFQRH